jgi:5'(3')-deoxyribonucleotidase
MNTIHLDMDGVVADWVAGATHIIGYRLEDASVRYPREDWARLRAEPRLFAQLPLMEGAEELVRVARRYRDELGWNLVFLTAIPHNNDMHWTFWDKFKWCEQYFPDIPVHFGPYSEDKYKHCEPGDILVDDRLDNCESWRAAGGVAFRVAQGPQGAVLIRPLLESDLESRLAQKLECE